MTAGAGVQHSEMFPLVNRRGENTLELFQIWMNLPKADKMAAPHFKMLWREEIPVYRTKDKGGKSIAATLVAGALGGLKPPSPPPNSWAADPEHDVAIWIVELEAGAEWTLPAARPGSLRHLYFFRGNSLRIRDQALASGHSVEIDSEAARLRAGDGGCSLLLLQGRPIGEPVAQYGPFVMNTEAEIQKAFEDYRKTQFGGWPWKSREPVHAGRSRFARHADGREESRPGPA